MLKKALSALAIATLALSAQAADVVLKVAASSVPHAEILNFVKPQLKAEGIDLQVREFSDYIQPNAAVEDKQLDANYFQHQPYLDSYNKDRKSSIVAVPNGKVHIEPFGAYSKRIKAVSELKAGRVDFKVDKAGVLHAPLGKVSFGPEKILGNLKALLDTVNRLKPSAAKGAYMLSMAVSTTMGPGFKVDMTQVKKFLEG